MKIDEKQCTYKSGYFEKTREESRKRKIKIKYIFFSKGHCFQLKIAYLFFMKHYTREQVNTFMLFRSYLGWIFFLSRIHQFLIFFFFFLSNSSLSSNLILNFSSIFFFLFQIIILFSFGFFLEFVCASKVHIIFYFYLLQYRLISFTFQKPKIDFMHNYVNQYKWAFRP